MKIYQYKASGFAGRFTQNLSFIDLRFSDVGMIKKAAERGYCAGYRAAIKDVLSLTESLMGDADRVLYEPYIKQILTDTEQ